MLSIFVFLRDDTGLDEIQWDGMGWDDRDGLYMLVCRNYDVMLFCMIMSVIYFCVIQFS